MMQAQQNSIDIKDQTLLNNSKEDGYKLPSQVRLEKKQKGGTNLSFATTAKVAMLRPTSRSNQPTSPTSPPTSPTSPPTSPTSPPTSPTSPPIVTLHSSQPNVTSHSSQSHVKSHSSEPHVTTHSGQSHVITYHSQSRVTSHSSTPRVTFSNRAEEIMKSELGPQEYEKRLQRQKLLFEKGCKKGGFTDLFSLFMTSRTIKNHFEKITKETKKRATHASGVGALGYAVFDPEQKVPLNDFFSQGRVFEVRARHSNSPWSEDDRRVGWRSLSVKFADHHLDSPLDFIFQTGYISKFFSAEAMEDHIAAMEKQGDHVKMHLLSLPVYLQAVLDGFRKMPDSYYQQHYHSQMVYNFVANDGRKRVAKFRIIPSESSYYESGRLTPQDQREAWFYMLMDKKESDVSPNYLKMEFADRLKHSNIVYKLQIQLHEITDADNHMIYNPGLPWDDDHPWLNLGTITLTTSLPSEVIEQTRFNVGNIPEKTISFPEGTSVHDFNIVPTLRKEIYETLQKHRPLHSQSPPEGQTTEYLVHVATGHQSHAGNTDPKCGIYVCIVGTRGRTTYRRLDRKPRSDFEPGAKTTFSIYDKIVGDFLCLKICKDRKGSKTDWFLEYVILTTPYNSRCYKLTCSRWLTNEMPAITLRSGAASLLENEKDGYLKLQRSMEVANKKALYPWVEKDKDEQGELHGLPGYAAAGANSSALPKDFRLENEREIEHRWAKHVDDSSSFMRTIKNMFKSRKGAIDVEYNELVSEICDKERSKTLEHVIVHWKDDAEFVRQLINYIAPLKIKECRELPSNFPVTNSIVSGLLERGKTIEEELEDGKIFIITFPELEEFCQYDLSPDAESNLEAAVKQLADDEVSITDSIQLSLREEDSSANKRSSHRRDSESDSDDEDGQKKRKSTRKSTKKPKAKAPKELRKYLCAPQVLIYNKSGVLIPLAIQLSQDPPEVLQAKQPLIFTMKDNGGEYSDWLIAKMWVKTAAAHVHHISMHILSTHLLMEPVAIAVLRNLPTCHPIFKLLMPHLRHVIAINTIYRKHVLPHTNALSEFMGIGQEQGQLLDFMRQQYGGFKLGLLNLPDAYAEKGVLEDEVLPGYYYRDDSLRLWEAVQDFVTVIVAVFYNDNEDVTKDKELSNMLKDMRSNGFHRRAEIPERFVTLGELVKFLTNVIYRCSVHHSVSTNTMLDMYTFAPNAPPCMMRPPPICKRGISGWEENVVRFMLPPPDLVERYVEAMKLMNSSVDEDNVLGKYPNTLFTEEKALGAIKSFQKRLKKIGKEIKKRNEKLDLPYEYFLPEKLHNNITC